MKKLVSTSLALFICLSMFAQVKMPAPSPTQTLKQDFGIGDIELKYSRPSAKGRKVYGELVPFNKLWRTGANGATVITFSEPVEINGKKLDTGTYAIYTIPNLESWEVIFNKGLTSTVATYKESEDVIRVKAETAKLKNALETFTMEIGNIRPESCELNIMWEKTLVTLKITTNIKQKIKAQLEAALQSAEKKPYWQAAQFYTDYESNTTKALENVTKALDENPKAYWMWLYKAKIQKDMGDNAGAKLSSQKSLELATAEKNDDYIKMNQELLKKL